MLALLINNRGGDTTLGERAFFTPRWGAARSSCVWFVFTTSCVSVCEFLVQSLLSVEVSALLSSNKSLFSTEIDGVAGLAQGCPRPPSLSRRHWVHGSTWHVS